MASSPTSAPLTGGGSDPALPADCSAWIVFLGQEFYFPGVQKVVRVIPGAPYQIPPLYLHAQGASVDLRIVIRDMNENLIGYEEITVPADTTVQSVGFSVLIPEGVTQVVFRIGHIGSGTPPRVFIGCPRMLEGLPATTAGDIFLQLFDDATINHVADGRLVWEDTAVPGTTYVEPSFTTVTDSAGVVWDNDEMSFTAKRGQNYQQVAANLAARGYRCSITPSNTAGQWLLNLYNPGWVKVDATALATPAINVGSGVTSGPIFRTHLSGNAVTVEGYQGFFGRSASALSIAAIGRREVYQTDRAITTTPDAAIRAAEEVSVRIKSGLSVAVNIEPAAPPVPLTDWDVDWLVNVQVPPAVTKSAHQVAAITVSVGADKTAYKASFSSESFTGGEGVARGVERLLEKYDGFEREPSSATDIPFISAPLITNVFSLPGQAFVEVGRLRMHHMTACMILSGWAAVNVAPTGASLIVDVNVNGVSIFPDASLRLTIPAGSKVSQHALVNFQVPANSYITIDTDQVGSTLPGT